jgi:hypothetical protein
MKGIEIKDQTTVLDLLEMGAMIVFPDGDTSGIKMSKWHNNSILLNGYGLSEMLFPLTAEGVEDAIEVIESRNPYNENEDDEYDQDWLEFDFVHSLDWLGDESESDEIVLPLPDDFSWSSLQSDESDE